MDYLYRILDKFEDWYLQLESFSDPSPFGKDTQVFWIRRNQIFPRFDRGFQTDAVGLFSVTPRKIANEIAANINANTILDAFCGVGATAIAFAKAGIKVIAVDINQARLEMARHNAKLEGVDKNMEFVCADAFSITSQKKSEAIFLDPPWGGVDYLTLKNFKLKNFEVDAVKLLNQSFQNYQQVIFKVPRQFDLSELDQFGRKYTAQENKIRSKIYCKTVYFR